MITCIPKYFTHSHYEDQRRVTHRQIVEYNQIDQISRVFRFDKMNILYFPQETSNKYKLCPTIEPTSLQPTDW